MLSKDIVNVICSEVKNIISMNNKVSISIHTLYCDNIIATALYYDKSDFVAI